MAGRPAAGSTTGLLVGMCVAIGIALVALILLVLLWTKQEELRNTADRADENAGRLMKSAEMQGAMRAWVDQATSGKSVAKVMNDEMTALGALISSDAATPSPGISKQLTDNQLAAFWQQVESDALLESPAEALHRPLLDATKSFYDLFKSEKELNIENHAEIERLQNQIKDLTQANEELQAVFDSKAEELQTQLSGYEKEWADFRDATRGKFDELDNSNQQRPRAHLEETQGLREQLNTVEQELDHKAAANRELQDRIREFQILPQPRRAARRADGTILLARGGERSVFIDLGINDRLILGMRFAVYPPETGVPHSGIAKAAIEVESVGEEVSVCRIKWDNPLFPILQGDIIANPIYDRERQLSFVVFGIFDLNHDGLDDHNGDKVIATVVREAGGAIARELTPRIDFVIVGARPRVSVLPKDPTENELAIHAEEVRVRDEFNALISEALSLSIPVLTQETFLDFLGRRNCPGYERSQRDS